MTASRLYLPKLESPPPTILEYLFVRFPRIHPDVWRSRVSRGVVTLSDGTTLRPDSPYRHGIFVFYRREVPSEPEPAEEPLILHQDDDLLVIDKPHGMPVTPVGQHVGRSLLAYLERTTGLENLAPAHRLDRDTAGLLLLTTRKELRARYHNLFAEGRIEREYHALAHIRDFPDQTKWRVENRVERGEPWFRQRIVAGPPNAVTEIELLKLGEDTGIFRLVPRTGKKHQLRLHLASIGFPIVGDPFYPEITEKGAEDPPLQLLATRLTFVDPLSGNSRTFSSSRLLRPCVSGQ